MAEVIDVDTCRELAELRRNRYFTGHLLTEKDLTDEQSYIQGRARRHNRYLHGFGVVCGLRVVPGRDRERRTVVVEPGLALDPWGREIAVPEPVELDLSEYIGGGPATGRRRSGSVFVMLEYAEVPAEMVPVLGEPPGAGDAAPGMPSRTRETFRLSLRREPPHHGPDPARAFCDVLADAVQQPVDAKQLHRTLCELLADACDPCAPDPAITLAEIHLGSGRGLAADAIDNCSHRRLLLSVDQILEILVCVMARLGH